MRHAARDFSAAQDGVVSRSQLRGIGVDAAAVRREVRADRWQLHGRETVATHTATLTDRARQFRAVWEAGPAAALDGVSALIAAGATGLSEDIVHLSAVHDRSIPEVAGVKIHKVIRRVQGELVLAGVPRVRPSIAAVRAAHWAVSDRQAALYLTVGVQQRLMTGTQLREAANLVRGRTRRAFIRRVVSDVADGSHSLAELDLVEACRRRGIPQPNRQAIRRTASGRIYLDVAWDDARLVVEVDGSGHVAALQQMDDSLRQNAVALGDELVLRVPLLSWRLNREAHLDQVCAAYFMRCGRWGSRDERLAGRLGFVAS